jgi:hypothetical protein
VPRRKASQFTSCSPRRRARPPWSSRSRNRTKPTIKA